MAKSQVSSWIRWVLVLGVLGALGYLGYSAYQRTQPAYLLEQAAKASENGDRKEAEVYLRNVLSRDPENGQGHRELAKLLLANAKDSNKDKKRTVRYLNVPEAITHLQLAANALPKDQALQEEVLKELMDGQLLRESSEIAARVTKLDPKNVDAAYVVAWRSLNEKQFSRAKKDLRALAKVEKDPRFRSLGLSSAVYDALDDVPRVQEVIDAALTKASNMEPEALANLEANDARVMRGFMPLGLERAKSAEQAQARLELVVTALEKLAAGQKGIEGRGGEAAELAVSLGMLLVARHPLDPTAAELRDARKVLLERVAVLAQDSIKADTASLPVYRWASSAEFEAGLDEAGLRTLHGGLKSGASRIDALDKQLANEKLGETVRNRLEADKDRLTREMLDLHLQTARKLVALSRFAEAETNLKALLDNPESAGWGNLLSGNVAGAEARYDQALDHLLKAKRMLGDLLLVRMSLANTYLALEQYTEALPLLAKLHVDPATMAPEERTWAAQMLGDGTAIHLAEAQALLALKQWDAALPHLEAVKNTPFEPRGVRLVFAYYWKAGRQKEALDLVEGARRKYPHELGLVLAQIAAFEQAGKLTEAANLIRDYATENPDSLNAQVLVAQWDSAQGKHDEAVAWLDGLVKKFPDKPELKVLKARIYLVAGNMEQALAVAKELEGDPRTAQIAVLIGAEAALKDKNLGQASDLLATMSPDVQRSGAMQLWRGQLAAAQQDYSSAVDSLAHSLTAKSTGGAARATLFRSLIQLAETKSAEEVLTKVKELLAENPKEPVLLLAQADLAARHGDFGLAMESLDKFEAVDPKSAEGAYYKALTWVKRNRMDMALEEFQRGAKLDPKNLAVLTKGAETALRAEKFTEALGFAAAALQQNNQLLGMYLIQAEALAGQKNRRDAEKLLEALVKNQPQTGAVYVALGNFHDRAGDVDKALEALGRGRQVLPRDAGLIQAEIGTLARANRLDEAQAAAEKAASEGPEIETLVAIARGYQAAEKAAEAREWAEKAMVIATDSQKVGLHWLEGDIAIGQGQRLLSDNKPAESRPFMAQAAEHFTAVLDAQPRNYIAGNNLAWILATQLGEGDKALEVAEKVKAIVPFGDMPAPFVDTLATIYRTLNRLDEARKVLDEGLTASGDDPTLLMSRMQLNLLERRYDDAHEDMAKLEKAQRGSADPIFQNAKIWLQTNRVDQAILELQRGLRVQADHLPSRVLLAELYLGQKQYSEALTESSTALSQDGKQWTVFLLQAEALAQLDRKDEATSVLTALIESQPKMAGAYSALAARQLADGHGDLALATLQRGRQALHDDFGLKLAEIGMLCKLDKVDEAQTAAQAVASSQSDVNTLLALGRTFLTADRFDEARSWAAKASANADAQQQIDLELLQGDVDMASGRKAHDKSLLKSASKHYEAVLATMPNHFSAGNNLGWLLASELDEPARALEVVEKVRGNAPVELLPATFVDTLATVYRASNKLETARDLLEQAIVVYPNEAVLQYQLGLVYSATKNKEAARKALGAALFLGLSQDRTDEAKKALSELNAEG